MNNIYVVYDSGEMEDTVVFCTDSKEEAAAMEQFHSYTREYMLVTETRETRKNVIRDLKEEVKKLSESNKHKDRVMINQYKRI